MSYTKKKKENEKLKIQQPSSLTFPSELLKVPNIILTPSSAFAISFPRLDKQGLLAL